MSQPNEIDFLLRVESGRSLVDMNYALDTMKGFSSTISAVSEGALSNEFKSKSSVADDIRTELLEGFLGSYVQKFRLKINDPLKEKRLKSMSNSVLAELITYYVNEVLHTKQPELSKKTDKHIKRLEPIENKIIDRISSWVEDMHILSVRKNYTVKLYRLTDLKKYSLFEVNKTTYGNAFELTEDTNATEIEVVISRFNIFTGNGRLLIDGENSTIPFGFSGAYSKVKGSYKKKISRNLSANTAVPDERRVHITLKVKPKRNKSNEVVKFVIYEVEP
ncbi:TPA: hypothetical protein ACPZRY_001753 [Yersinia enterocolitica]|uniref:hypothetical protein n=1 Tax=Yersinia enterocolitica TaxID=630 RepID=UPI0032FDBFF0|nr:hypothetical protein [Yersinia enterocolitica]EKN4809260.1 hypothetical protein [Yersinia enterocolitica]HDL7328744.1 hypothetical protein [Yersinia enterocolitica]HDL7354070.1 hypothetical protein [Yersinia enterocolitica]HDL7958885.1 hypothetical protein [Yersinia enterocolitica]